jgi:Universal stress protein UspA and related nucleotide-binding proteins
MAFKDILVHVDNSARSRTRLEVAAHLARGQGGHVIALNVRAYPVLPPFLTSQFGSEIERVRNIFNAEAAAGEARAFFDGLESHYGVTAEWRDVDGTLAECIGLHARCADIAVIGQDGDGEGGPALSGALVLAVGRPVLVVPYAGDFSAIGQRVVVGWNGSREATRAVHDALPILKGARQVRVIVVNPGGDVAGHNDGPGADIRLHLSRHGVNAVCEHIESDDLKVGEMLLSRAGDEAADLIVMGAYGRSRLRELVLGGATRHILNHMTVPVLLSH